ncbi:MAG: hypothetical protein HRU10_09445 [Opitutales bacterium]|nr:hypothetical protein [Opitutales bacterium]
MSNKIPKYFAGWQFIRDRVEGGWGQTIDDAVEDYLFCQIEDDLDCACIPPLGENITVEIFSVMSRADAINKYGEDDIDEDWVYVLGEPVEERVYFVSRDGEKWTLKPISEGKCG